METIVLCACGKCPHRNLVFCFPSHRVCAFSLLNWHTFCRLLSISRTPRTGIHIFIFGHIFSGFKENAMNTNSIRHRTEADRIQTQCGIRVHGMACELEWKFKNKTTIGHSMKRPKYEMEKKMEKKSILSETAVHRKCISRTPLAYLPNPKLQLSEFYANTNKNEGK